MLTNQEPKPTSYLKASQGDEVKVTKKQNFKAVAMLLGFLVFIIGAIGVFMISQNQDTTPVAPTAPQSQPAAFIEKAQTCTLVFDVTEPDKLACGEVGCESDSDCGDELICTTADDDKKYCSKTDHRIVDSCKKDPNAVNCCSIPVEEPLVCGEVGCVSTDDCSEGLVCITADDDKKYCADQRYLSACIAEPNEDSCCSAPPTTITPTDEPTVTPTDEPTVTPTGTVTVTKTVTPTTTVTNTVTPSVTTVITTVGCNDVCQANADCANISHICYQGQCRLDVNPTDAQCRLPSGETTIVRPVHVPTQSGPADWLNYLKAGLGVLGIGALLLLLL